MKVDSYDSLPIEKALVLHNIIILIKTVLNKDKNHYYHKIFLEKCLKSLKNNHKIFFHGIIMLRFGETRIAKKSFMSQIILLI